MNSQLSILSPLGLVHETVTVPDEATCDTKTEEEKKQEEKDDIHKTDKILTVYVTGSSDPAQHYPVVVIKTEETFVKQEPAVTLADGPAKSGIDEPAKHLEQEHIQQAAPGQAEHTGALESEDLQQVDPGRIEHLPIAPPALVFTEEQQVVPGQTEHTGDLEPEDLQQVDLGRTEHSPIPPPALLCTEEQTIRDEAATASIDEQKVLQPQEKNSDTAVSEPMILDEGMQETFAEEPVPPLTEYSSENQEAAMQGSLEKPPLTDMQSDMQGTVVSNVVYEQEPDLSAQEYKSESFEGDVLVSSETSEPWIMVDHSHASEQGNESHVAHQVENRAPPQANVESPNAVLTYDSVEYYHNGTDKTIQEQFHKSLPESEIISAEVVEIVSADVAASTSADSLAITSAEVAVVNEVRSRN